MIYGSVCSGVEAASLAWEPLGWQPAWFAEIEPFPSAVLAHRWPHVVNLGDMTGIAELVRQGAVAAPDVLVGGTPCQAFSIAGLRGGLSDERGILTLELVKLLEAIDERRKAEGLAGCTLVWENVPGVLSSRDNAFGCFLAALAGEDTPLVPPGRKWTNAGSVWGPTRAIAWRVLDAQYFGVAQRRRRVFLVASSGGVNPAEILFERQGVRRDTPPGRSKGEGSSGASSHGAGTYGGGGRREIDVATTLTAHGQRLDFDSETFVVNGRQDPVTSSVAYALGSQDNGMDNVVFLRGNLINRGVTSGGNGSGIDMDGVCPTLTTNDLHAVQYADTVRRLMPVEWERLQGMPDGHTQVPWRGKVAEDCPDGNRYKAIGNSMAIPVMRWLGERIMGRW